MTSALASRIDVGIARGALVGLVVATVVLAVTVVGGRPIPHAGLLLVPAIPLLFAGQAWSIALINARRAKPSGSLRDRMAAQWSAQRNPRTLFFPDLPLRAAYGLYGAFVVGWVAGMTAFPSLSRGVPSPGSPVCRWPLDNHGLFTCVSHAVYLQVSAAGERLAAGVMLGFFAVHFGVATSEAILRRRQDTADSRATPPAAPIA